MDWASEARVENDLGFSRNLLDFYVNGKKCQFQGGKLTLGVKENFDYSQPFF